jgi:hypothetical protein
MLGSLHPQLMRDWSADRCNHPSMLGSLHLLRVRRKRLLGCNHLGSLHPKAEHAELVCPADVGGIVARITAPDDALKTVLQGPDKEKDKAAA